MLLQTTLTVLTLTAATTAQQLQCHVQGQCSGISVGFSPASHYNECLDNCKDNQNCRWFTHNDNNSGCIELYDCSSLDATCTSCRSGQVECFPEGPVCDASGVCIGQFVAYEVVRSVEECLRFCQSVENCQWYSYRPDTKECQLTEDCIIFDGSCTDCLAGERECPVNAPVCDVHGVCIGHFIGYEIVPSTQECLRFCQSIEECLWYSYLSDTDECQLTQDCVAFDGSCTNCLAGERECPLSPPEPSKLFVIGGSGAESSVEIHDLSEVNLICPTAQDFPMYYGSVGTFIDNNVMVCGGYDGNGGVNNNECYNYDPSTDSWTETHMMTTRRYQAAAAQLSPTKWWITGGSNGTTTMISTEMFTVGEGFSAFADLPLALDRHNLVAVNETHAILLECKGNLNAWIFNMDTEAWTQLPDLLSVISSANAGVVTYPDGSKEVVVGPDYYSDGTQILNLNTLTWRYGPDYPAGGVREGACVPYGDTFLVVGGYGWVGYEDTIFKYEVEGGGGWSLLPQRLANPRAGHAAVIASDDFVSCAAKEK